MEKGKVVFKSQERGNLLNNYFNDITKGLNIKKSVSEVSCVMTHM